MPAPPLRVLIVDPDPDDRDYCRRLLRRAAGGSSEVSEAAGAAEGLRMIRETAPDCVVLEYRLPDADGFALLKACAETDHTTAFMMVTAHGTETTAAEAMRLGAHDYLAKAAVLEGHFAERVRAAVERARLKEQVRAWQKKLEETNAEMAAFTHVASHDLRAPLNRILYFCRALEQEAAPRLEAAEREYLNRMQVNGHRLLRLIDDLLAYSRTLHAAEAREETDLSALLAAVADDLSPLIEETGARITAGPLPKIPAYPLRLQQLLQNLVANALKYRGPAPPRIHVECARKGAFYEISVADNGMGIDKKNQDRIFSAFERLHAQDEIEGSGIGLATCRKAAELHGGTLRVESEPGKGSTFIFTVEAAPRELST